MASTPIERIERTVTRLGPLVGLILLLAAIWAVHRTLHGVHWHEVQHQLASLGAGRWAAALGLTATSYAALSGYEWLAARHIGLELPTRRILLAGALGWAVSNTVGHAWLSGGAVRMRLYSGWGVKTGDVGRILAFDSLAFASGAMLLTGTALALDPPEVFAPWGRWVGLGLLLALTAAFAALAARRRPLVLGSWSLSLPTPRMFAAQLLLSAIDQLSSIGALYALLSGTQVTYPELVSLFSISWAAGVASGVPGGAGTLDGTLISLASGEGSATALASAVLGWRLVYDLLPLALAAAVLAGLELRQRRGALPTGFVRSLAPPALAGLAFAAGMLLLVSASTPAVPHRLRWVVLFEPLALIETSHAGSALVGVWLLFVARGLLDRLRDAWRLLVALTLAGGVLSVLKGLDWEEALLLAGVLAVALPNRREFYRTAALGREVLSLPWALAVGGAVCVAGLVLVHAYLHVPWSHELLWTFAAPADVPRSLRAFGLVASVSAAAILGSWLRPLRLPPDAPTDGDLADAQRISAACSATSGGLAALRDKALLFDDDRSAFLMYGSAHGVWVCYAGPIGPPERAPELLWRFRELAGRAGARIALYEVGPDLLPVCVDLGLQVYKFGEDAVVPLEGFTLEGGAHKGRRSLLRRFERDGVTFEVLPAGEVPSVLGELRAVSDAWLSSKSTREKRFSLGFFDEDYLLRAPVAVVRLQGRIVAFANLLVAGRELSVDLMRFGPDAPSSSMEYLFVSLFAWGAEQGFGRFVLGMAPLAGLPDRDLAPLWAKLGTFVFRNGEAFYNFQGLRDYKEKFHPRWEPRYLAVQGPFALPATLRAINALVSGSMLGALRK